MAKDKKIYEFQARKQNEREKKIKFSAQWRALNS